MYKNTLLKIRKGLMYILWGLTLIFKYGHLINVRIESSIDWIDGLIHINNKKNKKDPKK